MRLRIMPLQGEIKETVKDVLVSHPEWYEGYDDLTVMHAHFYQVLTQAGELAGFFALCYWENEVVLACVYVYEPVRQCGVFKKMVKFALKHTPKHYWLTINASRKNKLANQIYSKMFEYHHEDEVEDIYWYVIKQAR